MSFHELIQVLGKPGVVPKFRKFWDVIQMNGGFLGSFWRWYLTDDLKDGYYVGKDEMGNAYYENKRWYVGRSRWVVYTRKVLFDYDGSQIPAEWHRWMHYITDIPPTEKPQVEHKWMLPHVENKTGTKECYTPYSTTRPKIQAWQPPKPSS